MISLLTKHLRVQVQKQNAFDGDPNTLAALDSNAGDATITWDASSYNLSTADNNIVVRSATADVQWKATGSTGTQTITSVSDPDGYPLPDVGTLQTLEVIGAAASLMYVKSGGNILTDNSASTSLTLTDDTDLDIFEVGDSVHPLGANSLVFQPTQMARMLVLLIQPNITIEVMLSTEIPLLLACSPWQH